MDKQFSKMSFGGILGAVLLTVFGLIIIFLAGIWLALNAENWILSGSLTMGLIIALYIAGISFIFWFLMGLRNRSSIFGYRYIFYAGLVLMAIGLLMQDYIISFFFGFIPFLVGLINAGKWKTEPQIKIRELPSDQKITAVFLILVLIIAFLAVLPGWYFNFRTNAPDNYSSEEPLPYNDKDIVLEPDKGEASIAMTEAEARAIAEKNCMKTGESVAFGIRHENTRIWWFIINTDETGDCYPVCAVFEDTKTAKLDMRCPGERVLPGESEAPAFTITNFDECVAAGNPVMESYPRQCSANGQTFTEQIAKQEIFCREEDRAADVCIQIYDPVCATLEALCTQEPCEKLRQTFSNSCEACRNPLVESYTSGKCIEPIPNL